MQVSYINSLPICIILLPAIVPFFSMMFARKESFRDLLLVVLAALVAICSIVLSSSIVSSGSIEVFAWELIPAAPILIRVDLIGSLFAVMAAVLWTITSLYALGYLEATDDKCKTRFLSFLGCSLSATFIVAFAGNLLTLYIGYELLSISTYPLVTHYQNETAQHAGRKYLFYILGSSIAFALPAMILTYLNCGTLEFVPGGIFIPGVNATLVSACLFLFLFGFAKAALMPVHSWLPGAMVAPTPVSALLHAVAVVKVGVFSIFRVVVYIIGPATLESIFHAGIRLSDIGLAIACITMLFSAFVALSQDELKRRLAFSTISQLAYITMGTLVLSPKALVGALLHIGVHAVSKITLFFCAGSIYVAAHKKHISQMSGIAKKMPYTMAAFTIASLSVVGFPFTAGFWSKWNLLTGTWQAGHYWVFGIYLLGSILAAFYLFPVLIRAYLHDLDSKLMEVREAAWKVLVPLLTTTALVLILFFFAPDLVVLLDWELMDIFNEELL